MAKKTEILPSRNFLEWSGAIISIFGLLMLGSLILNWDLVRGVEMSAMTPAGGEFGRITATLLGKWLGIGAVTFPFLTILWGWTLMRDTGWKRSLRWTGGCFVFLAGLLSFIELIKPGHFLGGALALLFVDHHSGILYRFFGVFSYLWAFYFMLAAVVWMTPLSYNQIGSLISAWASIAIKSIQNGVKPAMIFFTRQFKKFLLSLNQVLENFWNASSKPKEKTNLYLDEFEAPENLKPDPSLLKDTEENPIEISSLNSPQESKEEEVEEINETEKEKENEEKIKEVKTVKIKPPVSWKKNGKTSNAKRNGNGGALRMQFEDRRGMNAGDFRLPSVDLLGDYGSGKGKVSSDLVIRRGEKLEETLKQFRISAKITNYITGPTVTRYEIRPGEGVKISRITALQNDIALALAATSLRIEAPIPGKEAVGIEIPNETQAVIGIKKVMLSETFMKSKSPLTVALGCDIANQPVIGNLKSMPHLLIAGATGSGKSVCINCIIASILLNSSPEQVKLILIDPKMVELSIYQGIPHLAAPVVTNSRKAAQALAWVVREMERRYQYLARIGVRDIDSYNKKIVDLLAKEQEAQAKDTVEAQDDEFQDFEMEVEVDIDEKEGREEEASNYSAYGDIPAHIYFLVVIIDELADLMLVAAKDCEDAIQRITQMARAVGIHMIIATQRPSVDVITGVIKANLPHRIAFKVTTSIDSKTILDQYGADKLVGKGDMLYRSEGDDKPKRLQGCFINNEEVQSLVDFYKNQGIVNHGGNFFNEDLKEKGNEDEGIEGEDISDKEMKNYEDAVEFVISEGKASTSMIQRRLRIGYNTAARIVDLMEQQGVIGPSRGAKPREVLVGQEPTPAE